MNILIVLLIFITTVLFIEGSYFAFVALRDSERKKIRHRLRSSSFNGAENETIDIIRHRALSDMSWLNKLLAKVPGLQDLLFLLEQANSPYRVGTFLLLSLVLAFTGLLLGTFVTQNDMLIMVGTVLGGATPFVYLYRKKQQRMLAFLNQLPDALDLVARALLSGHTLMVGMKMVGDEFSDPIGTEFDRTVDEISFGIGVPEALKSLAHRVDCPDLHFFVIAVIIQRETGGNLAEIIQNISRLIRKRFELQGRVRALTAEGRSSAVILVALPFVVALGLSLLKPDYLEVLFTEPLGRGMLAFSGLTLSLGVLVIRKITKIKV